MSRRFIKYFLLVVSIALVLNSPRVPLWGQEKPKGPPPANVAVSVIKSGKVAPQTEFIGTVFYEEVSDVASELSGLVEVVRFEEGQRLKKGQVLIQLGSDLLKKKDTGNNRHL